MQCPYHPKEKVAGYCCICGHFGCDQCVSKHEGQYFCHKHYKPIEEKLEHKKQVEERKNSKDRQRLVVHTKKDRVYYGVCFALDVKGRVVNLDLVSEDGTPEDETRRFDFSELKAIFYVRSYDGKFTIDENDEDMYQNLGKPVVVEFQDGELLFGYTLHQYHADDPRFFILPEDRRGNNVTILIERSATVQVWEFDEFKEHHQHEIKQYARLHRKPSQSSEEVIGDFHFKRGDFDRAIKHYEAVLESGVNTDKVTRKISSAEYNIGVRQIKTRSYKRAISFMEQAMKTDPGNDKAAKKLKQLRFHLEKKKTVDFDITSDPFK